MFNKWIEKHNIEWIEYVIVDLAGLGRGKLITSRFLDKAVKLPVDIFTLNICGKFSDVIDDDGIVFNEKDFDLELVPDISTIRKIPWKKNATAQIICDAINQDGSSFQPSCRQVLKNVLKQYEERGWKSIVAPELEFTLINSSAESTTTEKLNSISVPQPYSVEILTEYNNFIESLNNACKIQEIEPQTILKEVGIGQYEINLEHGEALAKADETFRFKRTVREIAKLHGLEACFMAKPIKNVTGNSMHIHQSLLDAKTGQNLFSDSQGNNSELFNHYIGGLQKYLPEAIALFLPYINSYRRIEPFMCAPLNVKWGFDNRTVGLRVPISTANEFDNNKRVENRIPGSDCNPYLALATSLALGLQGITEKITPEQPYDYNAYKEPIEFVQSLEHAIKKLQQSTIINSLLGEEFIRFFCCIKQSELNQFNSIITDWEQKILSGVI